MAKIELYGGPMDGGYVNYIGTQPPAVIYTEIQPSNTGWDPFEPVPEESLRHEYSVKPMGRNKARYLFSPDGRKYMHDGKFQDALGV